VTYSELKEIYKDLQTDKYMIHVFRAIITMIAVVIFLAIGIFILHAVKDKPAKLFFGLAEINTVKTDTFYKLVPQKKDTIIKETIKYIPFATNQKKFETSIPIKKDTIPKNQTTSSGSNAHIINGNGNNVGVNGDLINGIKQRHLTDAVMLYLLTNLPDKNANIDFLFAGGKEGTIYATEIYNALINKGYKHLNPSNWMDPTDFDKVEVKTQNGRLQILINPASNVQ
jgi:hypothetical protein